MDTATKTRAGIAALLFGMADAVLFGAGLVAVLSIPTLQRNAGFWIALVAVASLLLAAPISWRLAPQLRSRHTRAALR